MLPNYNILILFYWFYKIINFEKIVVSWIELDGDKTRRDTRDWNFQNSKWTATTSSGNQPQPSSARILFDQFHSICVYTCFYNSLCNTLSIYLIIYVFILFVFTHVPSSSSASSSLHCHQLLIYINSQQQFTAVMGWWHTRHMFPVTHIASAFSLLSIFLSLLILMGKLILLLLFFCPFSDLSLSRCMASESDQMPSRVEPHWWVWMIGHFWHFFINFINKRFLWIFCAINTKMVSCCW